MLRLGVVSAKKGSVAKTGEKRGRRACIGMFEMPETFR
ncbi:hypothetical protein D515_02386 [Grimontia indica]|uniref:Uncharacterized protein n=1 Tax=Grimontia indica TaxID=1056512 RepID=R1GS23_9GAMM|nr:hypothetical protein D515_02386 [Grimontia indica]